MRRVLIVAIREFMETIRTKAFLFSLFFAPLVAFGGMYIVHRTTTGIKNDVQPAKRIAIWDETADVNVGRFLNQQFEEAQRAAPNRKLIPDFRRQPEPTMSKEQVNEQITDLKKQVRDAKLDALLFIPRDLSEGKASAQLFMVGRDMNSMLLADRVQHLVNNALIAVRCERNHLPLSVVKSVLEPTKVETIDVRTEAKHKAAGFEVGMMVPFFFIFLMFMSIFGVNGQMLTSVLEEKNSRVIEVILSAVSPYEFMAGKILGLSAAGIAVVIVWGAASFLAGAANGMTAVISPVLLVYFVIYFLLGFLLFSGLFAAVGSACNTIKEAQTLMMPVSLLAVIPLMGWMYFSQHPDAFWSRLLSFFPPLTPMLMILRISARPEISILEIIASMAVLAIGVVAVMWASGKVFRVGILMYGKAPTMRQLLRWIRYR